MDNKDDSLFQLYVHDYPADYEEAQEKWEALSRVIQMLEVLYHIPKEKIEKVLELVMKE